MAEIENSPPLENLDGFSRALRDAMDRAGLNQTGLSRLVKQRTGYVVAQNTISKWRGGKTPPERPAAVFAVEKALGLPPGALSGYLGYLPIELYRVSIETALAVDDTLDEGLRRSVRNLLSDLRRSEGEAGNPPERSA